MQHAQCPEWQGQPGDGALPTIETEDIVLPWTGSAIGLAGLNFVTGRAKPIIVSIAGQESAGKTTLLGAWYLLLWRGMFSQNDWRFGGSFSLEGWEAVASPLRFFPGQPPTFPPHTSSRGARSPGMLHLTLRQPDDSLREFLFADAPGEWFQKWAVDAADSAAEGARWLATHADVLLLVADSQALSGPNLGKARNNFQMLARRVSAERQGRPIALVWTKADIPVDPAVEKQIRHAVFDTMPDALEFSISVIAKDGHSTEACFLSLFKWIVSTRRPSVDIPAFAENGADPLFIYGKR